MPQRVASDYFSPAALLGTRRVSARQGWAGEKDDRFEPFAFAPSFDNPHNILKFILYVSHLHTQNHFG